MDSGYVNLLTPKERINLLELISDHAGECPFLVGAFIGEQPCQRLLPLDENNRTDPEANKLEDIN